MTRGMSRVHRRASVRSLIGTIFSTEPSALGTDVAMVPVRIALVWIFIYYGAGKLFGAFNGPGIHRTALFMSDTAHLHPGGLFAVLGGVIEFGGAIALALGVVSRLAGLALLGSGGGDGHRVVGARHQFAVGDARLRVQPGARRRRARCGPTESRRGHRTSPSIGWPACDPFGCGGVPITQLRTETTQSRRLASVKPGALVPGLPGGAHGMCCLRRAGQSGGLVGISDAFRVRPAVPGRIAVLGCLIVGSRRCNERRRP